MLYVHDFDNASGEIGLDTHRTFETVAEVSPTAGVSFSADSRYCYIAAGAASGKPEFYQFDLKDPDAELVSMDVTLPEGESGALIGTGQLAPDGNIYYNSGIRNYELSIQNPEKAYDGTESGAYVIFQFSRKVGRPRGLANFQPKLSF